LALLTPALIIYTKTLHQSSSSTQVRQELMHKVEINDQMGLMTMVMGSLTIGMDGTW